MIMGYGIIAVPTGIVTAEYTIAKNVDDENFVHVNTQACSNCNARKHRDDAEFCHRCGEALHPN